VKTPSTVITILLAVPVVLCTGYALAQEAPALTPFADFSAKAEVQMGSVLTERDDTFMVKATFTLSPQSDGIAPLSEAMTLHVGTFATTIPAGSFKLDESKLRFKFKGVIAGVALEAMIRPLGDKSFRFRAKGAQVELAGTANPVTLRLTICGDGGSTTVTAED